MSSSSLLMEVHKSVPSISCRGERMIVVGMVRGIEPNVTNTLFGVQILWWTIAPSAETISWTYVSNEAARLHVNGYGDHECVQTIQETIVFKDNGGVSVSIVCHVWQQEHNGTRDFWGG